MTRNHRLIAALTVIGVLLVASVSVVDADVGPDVETFSGSTDYGDLQAFDLNDPVVSMAPTPTGAGYWLVAADGGVFAFGDAGFFGSTGAIDLVSDVVGMAGSVSGSGYWLVAGDGGVFAFGDALFHGSAGAIDLARPIVGMASTPSGTGYWLLGDDGGVFTFGDADFFGSTGGLALDTSVIAIAATPDGDGYWLLGRDGGVFAFGEAIFYGSARDQDRVQDALAIGGADDGGYWILTGDGQVHTFGPDGVDPLLDARCQPRSVLGGSVVAGGVWQYTAPVIVEVSPNNSSATTLDGQSIAEQLSHLQACQEIGEPLAANFTHPLPGAVISSRYGLRSHPVWGLRLLHAGTDIVNLEGTFGVDVLSVASGTVVAVNERSAYGTTVLVDHGDRIASVYAHLSRVDVVVGETVSMGDPIGGAGATGFVTGAHLHVEIRVNGDPLNPEALLGL